MHDSFELDDFHLDQIIDIAYFVWYNEQIHTYSIWILFTLTFRSGISWYISTYFQFIYTLGPELVQCDA